MRPGNDEISRISERARQVSREAEGTRSTVKICKTARSTLASAPPSLPLLFFFSFLFLFFFFILFSRPAYSGPSNVSPPLCSWGSTNGYGPQVKFYRTTRRPTSRISCRSIFAKLESRTAAVSEKRWLSDSANRSTRR